MRLGCANFSSWKLYFVLLLFFTEQICSASNVSRSGGEDHNDELAVRLLTGENIASGDEAKIESDGERRLTVGSPDADPQGETDSPLSCSFAISLSFLNLVLITHSHCHLFSFSCSFSFSLSYSYSYSSSYSFSLPFSISNHTHTHTQSHTHTHTHTHTHSQSLWLTGLLRNNTWAQTDVKSIPFAHGSITAVAVCYFTMYCYTSKRLLGVFPIDHGATNCHMWCWDILVIHGAPMSSIFER